MFMIVHLENVKTGLGYLPELGEKIVTGLSNYQGWVGLGALGPASLDQPRCSHQTVNSRKPVVCFSREYFFCSSRLKQKPTTGQLTVL